MMKSSEKMPELFENRSDGNGMKTMNNLTCPHCREGVKAKDIQRLACGKCNISFLAKFNYEKNCWDFHDIR